MPSFFTQYNSFESRLEAAMNAGDVKLVQILLGPEYCQVWQYWTAHAMISHNMLAVERTASNNFPFNVYTEQIKMLEEQKGLLDKQEKFLKGEVNEATQGILPAKELLKKQFNIACDEAKKYREEIYTANRVVDGVHHLFYAPYEAEHASKNYIASNFEQNIGASEQNDCQSLSEKDRAVFSYESAFGCVSSALRSIDKVAKTKVVHECDLLISAMEKVISKQVYGDADTSARVLCYLETGDYWLNGDNGRALDAVIDNIPEHAPEDVLQMIGAAAAVIPGVSTVSRAITTVLRVGPRSVARGTIVGLRFIVDKVKDLLEKKHDDMSNLGCVKEKIEQIDKMIEHLKELRDDKQEMSKKLREKEHDIEEQVLNKLIDGMPIKKYFVEQMHDKLLNRYINYFLKEEERQFYNEKFKPSELLFEDMSKCKNECKDGENLAGRIRNAIKERIKEKPGEYEKFKGIMNKEICKTNPNLDVLSVLIANCANAGDWKGSLLKKEKNPEACKYVSKSINTIIMEAHEMLFDFYKHDNTLELVRKPVNSRIFPLQHNLTYS